MAKLVRIYAEKTLKKVPSSARTSRPSLTSASLLESHFTRRPAQGILRVPGTSDLDADVAAARLERSLAAAMAAEFDRRSLHLRVLAVGDSLTAGYYNGGAAFHPYCKRLETLLQTALDDREGKRTRCEEVGRSGWTSELIALKGPARGALEAAAAAGRAYTHVAVLAGTNDLCRRVPPEEILANLEHLWEMARQHGALVLALTIPGEFHTILGFGPVCTNDTNTTPYANALSEYS